MKKNIIKPKSLKSFEPVALTITQLCDAKGGCCGSDEGGSTPPPPGGNSTNGE